MPQGTSVPASELHVFLGSEPIGRLDPQPRRSREHVRFRWSTDASRLQVRISESFAMTTMRAPDSQTVSRFLGGYLPEGNQRKAMAAVRGIDDRDLFGFLEAFGGSIAGALSFHTSDAPPPKKADYIPLTPAALRKSLKQSVEMHDQAVRDDSRSMLPGFQPKLLVAKLDSGDRRWLSPVGRSHSTHILKPQLRSAPTRIYDEHYGHQLATRLGLSTFKTAIHSSAQTAYLAIERYDRQVDNGTVTCVHQEDAAQALSLDWTSDSFKFQDRDNPGSSRYASARRVGELAGTLTDPDAPKVWVRQFVFRILIGDNDGHAKNTGILHHPGSDTIADLYDAIPNMFQPGRIDWSMAYAVNSNFDHRRVTLDDIVAEVTSWRLMSESRAEALVSECMREFSEALDLQRVPAGASPSVGDALKYYVTRLQGGHRIGAFAGDS